MLISSHHHHIEKVHQLKSRLGRIYWHLVIQGFALSLVSIFVPVYLLITGFSLAKVFLFLMIEWSVFGLLAPAYAKIIQKIGIKEIIYIRTPIYVISLILLTQLEINPIIQTHFYIIALLKGFSGAIYTLSITSLFAENLGTKSHAEKTAKTIAFPRIVSILGPSIGGMIAFTLGFPALFIIVSSLMVLSIIPLGFVKQRIDHPIFRFRIFKRLNKNFKEFFFTGLFGIKGFVTGIILPIALYLFIKNIASLGLLISIISLISALVTIYIGKATDKYGINPVLKIGAGGSAILLLLIGLFLQSQTLLYLSLISGIFGALFNVPYETHLYEQAKKVFSPIEYLSFKEFSLAFGRIVLFSIAIIFAAQLDVSFYFGSFAALLFVFF